MADLANEDREATREGDKRLDPGLEQHPPERLALRRLERVRSGGRGSPIASSVARPTVGSTARSLATAVAVSAWY
jgi:hypothetical protein